MASHIYQKIQDARSARIDMERWEESWRREHPRSIVYVGAPIDPKPIGKLRRLGRRIWSWLR